MNQELEIEYKNLLTAEEYQKIKAGELTAENELFTQSNYYFDTKDQLLKKQGAALRIRITDTFNELTFKVPSQGFLMETNISLTDEQVTDILNSEKLSLNEITTKEVDLELNGITNQTTFYKFNFFSTQRIEKQSGNHLLVLDKTTFQNGEADYELEVESSDAVSGKDFFMSILNKYSIPYRPAQPKIARAESKRS